MLKRIVIIVFLFLCLPIKAVNLEINQIIFFGDSLTDNGNLYDSFFGFIPQSPPYFEGRFTNGHTWAEYVATYFKKENNVHSLNYAIGGATTIFHNPFNGYLPYTLSKSVSNYLAQSTSSSKSKTLFVIWIGGNDYLNGEENVDQLTTDVVYGLNDNIEKLISNGGKYFLILNLPDLAITPTAQTADHKNNIHKLTVEHNKKLNVMLTLLQKKHKDINMHIFDSYSFFNDFLKNTDKYNHTYKTNITQLSGSCWQGSYMKRDSFNQREDLIDEIEKNFQKHVSVKRSMIEPSMEPRQIATYIADSPDLSAAYDVKEKQTRGVSACKNPENYLFWDKVHPTAAVHTIISKVMIDYMNQIYAH